MSEFNNIKQIRDILGRPSSRVKVGIGDDTAVLLPLQAQPLFCSDLMIEGVHFDLRFASPQDVGFKALTSCLSDLAAMNGRPHSAVISLALPFQHRDSFIGPFYEGLNDAALKYSCDIVGGDLSSSPGPIFIDVACLGQSEKPILRSGAREGDILAVSGHPGASAAGLRLLQNSIDIEGAGVHFEKLAHAHLRPVPRFDLLSPTLNDSCTSLIDISDGLASEIGHIARASNVDFEIRSGQIPLHPEALGFAGREQALTWALHGGEDYELLATFTPGHMLPPGFTAIGQALPAVEKGGALTLVEPDGTRRKIPTSGFDHFHRS